MQVEKRGRRANVGVIPKQSAVPENKTYVIRYRTTFFKQFSVDAMIDIMHF